MAGKVLNTKACSPLKLRCGLIGNYHAICHYSYNLPLNPDQTDWGLYCNQQKVMKVNVYKRLEFKASR